MITIKQRENGFDLVLEGSVHLEDVRNFGFDFRNELAGLGKPFVLAINVLRFEHFTADAQAEFETVLEEAIERGLSRISVLAYSTGRAALFTEMMLRVDAMDMYQYIDMSYEEDWEEELEASLAIGD